MADGTESVPVQIQIERRDDDSYRRCCTANSWGGGVLCARIMGLDDE